MTRSMRLLAWLLALFVVAAAVEPQRRVSARAQRIVYIGTYTGEASKGIYAFRFDDALVSSRRSAWSPRHPSPSFLTASTDGRFLFAVNELQSFGGAPEAA